MIAFQVVNKWLLKRVFSWSEYTYNNNKIDCALFIGSNYYYACEVKWYGHEQRNLFSIKFSILHLHFASQHHLHICIHMLPYNIRIFAPHALTICILFLLIIKCNQLVISPLKKLAPFKLFNFIIDPIRIVQCWMRQRNESRFTVKMKKIQFQY